MKTKKDIFERKSLERFSYLKDIAQTQEEIHSAITVMRVYNDTCREPIIEMSECRKLGIRFGGTIFSLLAYYKEYLHEKSKGINKEPIDGGTSFKI